MLTENCSPRSGATGEGFGSPVSSLQRLTNFPADSDALFRYNFIPWSHTENVSSIITSPVISTN